MTGAESGARPESGERPPTEPEPTPREVRQREREARRGERPQGMVLVGQAVAGWIVGLVVGLSSVTLAALLWSSQQL